MAGVSLQGMQQGQHVGMRWAFEGQRGAQDRMREREAGGVEHRPRREDGEGAVAADQGGQRPGRRARCVHPGWQSVAGTPGGSAAW